MNCAKCEKKMIPAPAYSDGEPVTVGYLPCPCSRRLITDCGVVYPGSTEHKAIIDSGQFSGVQVL